MNKGSGALQEKGMEVILNAGCSRAGVRPLGRF